MTLQRRNTRNRLTRLGWQFMLIGLFGLLGGSLNGLNLLIVVAAMTLAVLLAQWRVSRSTIESVRVDRRIPAEVFAGKPARIRYQVSNRHPLMPLWMISLTDRITRLGAETVEAPSTTRSSSAPAGSRTIHTGVGMLLPSQATSAYLDVTFEKRGRYRLGKWRVSTTAPFSLSTAWRDSADEEEFVDVYPRLLVLPRSWRQRLPTKLGNVSSSAHRQGHADEVFFGLREYRRGDSRKHIHWRTTARIGDLVVRQFEQQRRLDICFLVDAYCPASAAEDSPEHHQVETAISLAASLVVQLFGGSGSQVMMSVAGEENETCGGGLSREALRRMLQILARTQTTAQPDLNRSLEQVGSAVKHLPDLVVLSPRPLAQVLATGDSQATLLREWQQRGRLNWVNLSGRDAAAWLADSSVASTAMEALHE
ncbi:DUF58 domain-containing protein [Rhodopirellula sp. JC740]|uniref:DUF58 domain-containing protein n=1 Tax=Rhodopirellula halodulae TaxID=2894198 RepID=A0ABS8NFR5_9BACT|nr:DUF58 domain-containing protein [Rhodopirellula sp. JC740]MCC9642396.1 DUF58 domain-containing protein [Rhodopirellula sp. JC740]